MGIHILAAKLIGAWFIVNLILWLFLSMFRIIPFIGPKINRGLRYGLTKVGSYMGLLACFQNSEDTIYMSGIEKLE